MFLKNVVIGSTLESLLYAYKNDYYFLSVHPHGPFFYERQNTRSAMVPALTIWNKIKTTHSLRGLIVPSFGAAKISLHEGKIFFTSENGWQEYEFGECDIFDSTLVDHENEICEPLAPTFCVLDDLELRRIGRLYKEIEPIYRESDSLVKEIHFYTSRRILGASYVTDCVSVSHLTREMLHDVEYSDTAVKFIIESEIITKRGVRGKKMGLYKTGLPKYYKPEATHASRTVIEQDNNVYVNSAQVRFHTKSPGIKV